MERLLASTVEAGVGGGTSQGAENKRDHHFHWSQQGHRVLEQLRALYSDQEGVGNGLGVQTDVVLFGSDGGFVEAHKMVLALCSPYFQDLFVKISQAKVLQGRSDPAVVVLPNVTSHQLKNLIQFIYTGESALSSDQVEEFLELGNAFKIDGITDPTNLSYATSMVSPSLYEEPTTSQFAKVQVPEKSSQEPSSTLKKESLQSVCEEQEDVDIDISFDSFAIKIESLIQLAGGSGGDGDTLLGDDPLAFGYEEEESQEKDDPTFQEEASLSAAKRSRSDNLNKVANAPQNPVPVNHDWTVVEAPSEQCIKQKWGRLKTRQSKNHLSIIYYCRAGATKGHRCPVQLKKITTTDGRVIWHSNKRAHANHSKTVYGLTPEQKQFVLSCAQNGVTSPAEIFHRFEADGKVPPKCSKIHYFLGHARQKP